MTKRGGRESGERKAELARENSADTQLSAAAEPAAHGIGGTDICPDCYHPHPDFRFIPGTRTLKHSYKLHERIRALEEAERTCKAANESHRKTLAVLEAELASWRTELASWRTEAERLGDKAVENGARAETAEAEVERLTDWNRLLTDGIRYPKSIAAAVRRAYTGCEHEPVEREGGT